MPDTITPRQPRTPSPRATLLAAMICRPFLTGHLPSPCYVCKDSAQRTLIALDDAPSVITS